MNGETIGWPLFFIHDRFSTAIKKPFDAILAKNIVEKIAVWEQRKREIDLYIEPLFDIYVKETVLFNNSFKILITDLSYFFVFDQIVVAENFSI